MLKSQDDFIDIFVFVCVKVSFLSLPTIIYNIKLVIPPAFIHINFDKYSIKLHNFAPENFNNNVILY